jgi:hypothetical protein
MSDISEWQRDAAVWLAGRRIEGQGSADSCGSAHAGGMAGFTAWRQAAEREAAAAMFAERVRAHVAAIGRGVRRIDRWPEPAHVPAMASVRTPAARGGRRAAPLVELGVAAGSGRELLDEPCETWVALPPDLPAGRYVALRVVGDSMVPLLHSGDVVLVDLNGTVIPGGVAVARHPEHGYVVKRVGRARAWGLPLESLNPAYPALALTPGRGGLIGPVVLRWCGHPAAKPRLAPGP